MGYFEYGEKEIEYLKNRDKRLGEAIELIGPIRREVHPDLFGALVNCIIGQQISTRAQETIWGRFKDGLVEVTPGNVLACTEAQLQAYGISFRKVSYIREAARQVLAGQLDLGSLAQMPDEEVCSRLVSLPGIGVWTAEMLMTFSMERPDVVSFGDLAILRGMRMLYHHREITKEQFERYRRRYSPYGTVASLYLWAIAGGAIEGWHDYKVKEKKQ